MSTCASNEIYRGCIPTVCYMCYSCCGIKVRLEDGIAVEICGDPANPHNQSKLCAKGKAGLISLYSPYRLKRPVQRTAPEKGIGVDPGWKEISWDEALEIIAGRMKKIRAEDPRKLVIAGMDFQNVPFRTAFVSASGTPNLWGGATGYFCGKGLHPVLYLTNGTFYAEPDFDHCRYNILFGTQLGFLVNSNAVTFTQRMAEARARGMKLVVVDPVGTNAAAKADEWIPIRPGTDAALALGIMNILLNELEIFDADFLRQRTNATYMVGEDGHYVRELGTGKPLVWDGRDNKAKTFDAPFSGHEALSGYYRVNGNLVRPAFDCLREHVKSYPPERVAQITAIPTSVIRRLAEDFGREARVGSTISVDGAELPFRPVCASWNKGPIAHKHAMMTGYAIQLLNIVVGAMDVPGGQLGCNPVGPFWHPREGPEGLIIPAERIAFDRVVYPAGKARVPATYSLAGLFPVSIATDAMFEEAVLHPDKFRINYHPEMMLNFRSNPMMSSSNPARMAEVLKRIPFVVHFTTHLDETAELADMVLPDTHYLERFVPFPNDLIEWIASGPGYWYWMVQQSIVEPAGEARSWPEVCLDLAEKAGFLDDLYFVLNAQLGLRSPFNLERGKKYVLEEIGDLWAKSWFGENNGIDQIKKNGFFISGKKTIPEAYPGPFLTARIPIYLEHFLDACREAERITKELRLHWDVADYQPLPDWKPCPEFGQQNPEYPLYGVNFKFPFHTFSLTPLNPWLDELTDWHPYGYKVWLARQTGERLGLRDGDEVIVRSRHGQGKARLKLTECVHPEVVAIPGTFGHWASANPVGLGKGVHFNSLLRGADEASVDTVSGAMDSCVRVNIIKVG